MKRKLLPTISAVIALGQVAYAQAPAVGPLQIQNALSELARSPSVARSNLGAAAQADLLSEAARAMAAEAANSTAIASAQTIANASLPATSTRVPTGTAGAASGAAVLNSSGCLVLPGATGPTLCLASNGTWTITTGTASFTFSATGLTGSM